jgi:8-oxo-dGTP pyrophosphatase MutT (NUDIX family)
MREAYPADSSAMAEPSGLYGFPVGTASNPPIRRAARALIVDAARRVLLFRAELADRHPWWFAPGGALDPGETYEDAVVREVFEETGLVVDTPALSSPVWSRDVAFVWDGITERHIEQYFLIHVEPHSVDTARFEAAEAAVIRAHHWWALGEIINSDEVFAPKAFGALLAPLLRGELPESPVVVGE